MSLLVAAMALFGLWWLGRPDSTGGNVPELLGKAQSLLESGDNEQAGRVLELVLAQDPSNGMGLLFRGQVAMASGDSKAAFADWQRVPDSPPKIGGTARFLEATVLLQSGQSRVAEQRLRRATELNPQYVQPHERLLQLYVLQMRRQEILEQLQALQQLRSLTLQEMVLQLVAGERILEPAEGIRQTKPFVDADAADVHSRLALARYYLESGRDDDAKKMLQALLAEHPQNDQVRGLLAESLLQASQISQARAILLHRDPASTNSPELWKSIGKLALADGEVSRAAECFHRVIQDNPDDLTSCYRLGSLLARAGQQAESQRYLDQAVLVDRLHQQAMIVARGRPTQVEMLMRVMLETANLLLKLERASEAKMWFATVLAAQPNDDSARKGLLEADHLLATTSNAQPATPRSTVSTASVQSAAAKNLLADSTRVPEKTEPAKDVSQIIKSIQLTELPAAAGLNFQYFNGQTGFKYLIESMGGGVAVLDYDCDGWPDFYFPQGCRLPYNPSDYSHVDRLFRNRGDGTFQDVTNQAGISENHYSQGCTAGDIDNDGDPDLVIANYGRITILCNNGDGTFNDVTEGSGIHGEQMSSSVAFGDFDRDGDLDLYVVNYVDSLRVCRSPQGKISTCDPQNSQAEQDRIYCNRGDGTFEDVSQSSGILAPEGRGLGVVVADLDDDNWPDIYVANDGNPNFLFRNISVSSSSNANESAPAGIPFRFQEQGLLSGVAVSGDGHAQAGMGIACADLNGDQMLDLYVTNFYLEASILYLNQGNDFFIDATNSAGLKSPSLSMLGFGTQAIDVDLNGKPDLFVANGHIDDYRDQGIPWKMPAQLYYNLGAGIFREISKSSGPYFAKQQLGRGVARLDANRDGRPDVIVVHQDAPASLLINDTANAGNYLSLELHGSQSNRDAIGSRVLISAGNATQIVEVYGGDGFYACNDKRLTIGLGAAKSVDVLEIRWPSGLRERWNDIPAQSSLVIVEGQRPYLQSGPVP